jgi:hypothetical protein
MLERLPLCPLVIHALLHVPDDILWCGPSSSTWPFYGERFCGHLQNQLGSRSAPYANLTNRLIYSAYLTQIVCRYDLAAELALPNEIDIEDEDYEDHLRNNECEIVGCRYLYFTEDSCR